MINKVPPKEGISSRFPSGVKSGRMMLHAEGTGLFSWRILDDAKRELLSGGGYPRVSVGTVVRPTLPFYVEFQNDADEELIVTWKVMDEPGMFR